MGEGPEEGFGAFETANFRVINVDTNNDVFDDSFFGAPPVPHKKVTKRREKPSGKHKDKVKDAETPEPQEPDKPSERTGQPQKLGGMLATHWTDKQPASPAQSPGLVQTSTAAHRRGFSHIRQAARDQVAAAESNSGGSSGIEVTCSPRAQVTPSSVPADNNSCASGTPTSVPQKLWEERDPSTMPSGTFKDRVLLRHIRRFPAAATPADSTPPHNANSGDAATQLDKYRQRRKRGGSLIEGPKSARVATAGGKVVQQYPPMEGTVDGCGPNNIPLERPTFSAPAAGDKKTANLNSSEQVSFVGGMSLRDYVTSRQRYSNSTTQQEEQTHTKPKQRPTTPNRVGGGSGSGKAARSSQQGQPIQDMAASREHQVSTKATLGADMTAETLFWGDRPATRQKEPKQSLDLFPFPCPPKWNDGKGDEETSAGLSASANGSSAGAAGDGTLEDTPNYASLFVNSDEEFGEEPEFPSKSAEGLFKVNQVTFGETFESLDLAESFDQFDELDIDKGPEKLKRRPKQTRGKDRSDRKKNGASFSKRPNLMFDSPDLADDVNTDGNLSNSTSSGEDDNAAFDIGEESADTNSLFALLVNSRSALQSSVSSSVNGLSTNIDALSSEAPPNMAQRPGTATGTNTPRISAGALANSLDLQLLRESSSSAHIPSFAESLLEQQMELKEHTNPKQQATFASSVSHNDIVADKDKSDTKVLTSRKANKKERFKSPKAGRPLNASVTSNPSQQGEPPIGTNAILQSGATAKLDGSSACPTSPELHDYTGAFVPPSVAPMPTSGNPSPLSNSDSPSGVARTSSQSTRQGSTNTEQGCVVGTTTLPTSARLTSSPPPTTSVQSSVSTKTTESVTEVERPPPEASRHSNRSGAVLNHADTVSEFDYSVPAPTSRVISSHASPATFLAMKQLQPKERTQLSPRSKLTGVHEVGMPTAAPSAPTTAAPTAAVHSPEHIHHMQTHPLVRQQQPQTNSPNLSAESRETKPSRTNTEEGKQANAPTNTSAATKAENECAIVGFNAAPFVPPKKENSGGLEDTPSPQRQLQQPQQAAKILTTITPHNPKSSTTTTVTNSGTGKSSGTERTSTTRTNTMARGQGENVGMPTAGLGLASEGCGRPLSAKARKKPLDPSSPRTPSAHFPLERPQSVVPGCRPSTASKDSGGSAAGDVVAEGKERPISATSRDKTENRNVKREGKGSSHDFTDYEPIMVQGMPFEFDSDCCPLSGRREGEGEGSGRPLSGTSRDKPNMGDKRTRKDKSRKTRPDIAML